MKQQTILQLDQINQKFYAQIANEFSSTRSYPWPGWKKFLSPISFLANQVQASYKNESLSKSQLLDLGCGNGRLAHFLHQHLPYWPANYLGLERESQLLELSKLSVEQVNGSKDWTFSFQEIDIIQNLINHNLKESLQLSLTNSPQVIFLISVLHHIPSFSLRKLLLHTLASLLNTNGLLIFNSWHFLNSEKLRSRIVNPNQVNFKQTDLEENDYFLDWKAGKTEYRYCHFINSDEKVKLLESLPLKIIDEYFADGHTNNLNHYFILSKI